MDDTITKREKVLNDLIAISLKEISLEYIKGVDLLMLEQIKQEFVGKTFQVSQKILGANSMQISYENQLKNFEITRTLIGTIYEKISGEQKEFEKKTQQYNIMSEHLSVSESAKSELRAAITELVLEGLCWIEPKILDKKEAGFVAA